jgi:predicted transcriptional regulator
MSAPPDQVPVDFGRVIKPEIRAKVCEELARGASPMEIARKLRLSLLAVSEIASGESTRELPKKPPPPLRFER